MFLACITRYINNVIQVIVFNPILYRPRNINFNPFLCKSNKREEKVLVYIYKTLKIRDMKMLMMAELDLTERYSQQATEKGEIKWKLCFTLEQ